MRLSLLAVASLLACGSATAPASSQLSIVLDPQTCTARVGKLEPFVDGVSLGWVSASPGGAWRLSVPPGQHTTSARLFDGATTTWPAETIVVPSGGEATRTLHC